jgi:hypothetical protein
MAKYEYYVVESSFVARVGPGTTERLTRDGAWVDYPDRWDVLTNGRSLENEEKALETAKQLFQLFDKRDAEEGQGEP